MKRLNSFLPYILPIFAFFLYLLTAPPFLLWLDASRFVAAIVTLGIANPPEPLYIMLAKPFTFIPFGSYIFRIQIFSALTAAITLFLLYKLILLQSNQKIALFGTVLMAFSYQFWSQAQNVETFILVTLIEVIILYLLIKAQSSKRQFFISLTLIALLMGLSTGTNPVILSIVPTILWVMWTKRQFLTIGGFATWLVVGIIAVIAVHLYIPIRASANPFLNYWRAQTLEGVWGVSTGGGLNVYVPEIGRVNGFTGSPEVFFKSTWHYLEMWLIKFTPILVPFMVAGAIYLWQKNRFYFIFWGLIVLTNWLFSSLYFSGNQESWFLVSDVAWVVVAGVGLYWSENGLLSVILKRFKLPVKYANYAKFLIFLALVPLIIWLPFLNRRDWVLTEDYIKNLYRPMDDEQAIIFGSSDLYDSISFYVHDIPGTAVYKHNVIPITDNLLYILRWYRDNLKSTTDLKIPDDAGLKYDSAQEYSKYANEFFAQNLPKYKIFITIPALRNNFLQAYRGQNLGPSLRIDETKFKLVPQGMLMQLVEKESTTSSNLGFFDYQFTQDFPNRKPFMLEQTYQGELTGMLNEYAYSLENLGDGLLREGKADQAFKYYSQAFDFNPKNAEVISRLGNYYGTIGNHQKAAEYFEKALKIEPNNVGLLFNSAIAHENTGRIDRAIKNYNRVLQLSKGQGQDQIAQLAQIRLNSLKQATPSAQLATGSANIQQQLLQAANVKKPYQSSKLSLQFMIPAGFEVTEEVNSVLKLSNNTKGKDELTFWFFSRTLRTEETLENLSTSLPFELGGPVLITQPVSLPGFEAIGKTIGSGEHLTFLLLMKKQTQGIAVKIYPGDSNKSEQLNQILQSIQTL